MKDEYIYLRPYDTLFLNSVRQIDNQLWLNIVDIIWIEAKNPFYSLTQFLY